jgi:hypothetical protein
MQHLKHDLLSEIRLQFVGFDAQSHVTFLGHFLGELDVSVLGFGNLASRPTPPQRFVVGEQLLDGHSLLGNHGTAKSARVNGEFYDQGEAKWIVIRG